MLQPRPPARPSAPASLWVTGPAVLSTRSFHGRPGLRGAAPGGRTQAGPGPAPAGVSDAPTWSVVSMVVSGRPRPAALSLGSRGPPRGAPSVPKEDLGMAGADRKSSSPAPREEQAASTVLTLLCWASHTVFSPCTNKPRTSYCATVHITVTTKSHHFCSYPFKHKELENYDISWLIQAYHFCLKYCHCGIPF